MSDRNVSGSLGVETHIRIGLPPNEILLSPSPGGASLLMGNSSTGATPIPVSPLFGPPMHTAFWYLPFDHGGLTTTSSFTNNRVVFIPYLIGKACTINGVAIDVTSAGDAAGVVRLGLYTDLDGVPGTLVADWGTVAADAIAVPTITPSTAVQAGWYWQAFCPQGVPSVRPTVRSYQSAVGSRVGGSSPGTATSFAGYYKDSVSGALPAAGSIDGTMPQNLIPGMWLKAA